MPRFACPVCNFLLRAPDSAAGKKGPCPNCGQRLQIPAPPRRTMLGIVAPPAPRAERAPALAPYAPDPERLEGVEMAPAVAGPGRWWRPLSPSALLLALIVFPLPFVELRCTGGAAAGQVMCSQSGLQGIYGGETFHTRLQAEIDQAKNEGRAVNVPEGRFSPALLLYPFALLAGVVVGFGAAPGPVRTVATGALGLFALALLAVQLVIGFPLEQRWKEAEAKDAKQAAERAKGGEGAFTVVAEKGASLAFEVRYTPWLYVAVGANVLALLLLLAEVFTAAARALG
jgi:hypothetical protein